MIDIQLIRDEPEKVIQASIDKGTKPDIAKKTIDEILSLDEKRRQLIKEIERLRAERNEITKEIKKSHIDALPSKPPDIPTNLRGLLDRNKKQLRDIEPQLKKIETTLFNDLILRIPNPAAEDVKVGKDESENEVTDTVGKPPKFTFKPKDHLELGENLDLIDVKRAAKTSGSRFAYLKNEAVLLELAIVRFAMDSLINEGFTPVIPPVLIKKDSMQGMGYLENGGEDDMYVLEKDNMVLVGTSEQSIGPMHSGEIINSKALPLRYAAFSTCFRREAGSYGKDTRGILRVHQFDKVEMFSYAHPEKSDEEHEFLLDVEKKLFDSLGIPYQVVKMCTGDLGAPATRKYDLEAWLPGQNKYREVTSASTTTDFQSRRLNIKFQNKGKTDFVHTLNGTAFAIGRTIIAILENFQQKDGSVKIPEVLQTYLGKKLIKADS